jgi:small subunit ribosomal protein S6
VSALVTYTLEALPRTSCSPTVGGPSRPEEVGLRPYEVMFILPAEADEKLVTTAVDRITKAIEPTGGSVLNIDRWGRRRFAYEIDRQNEGYYVVVAFDAEPSVIAPLERSLVLADEIMRAKVTIRHPQKPGRPGETSAASRRPTSRPAPEPQASTPEAATEAAPEQADTPEPQPEASAPEQQPDAEGASPETSDEATSPAPA